MQTDLRINLQGMLAVTGSAICFSTIDVVIKFLSAGYPLYQVIFIRSIVAMVVLLLILVPLEGGYHTLRTPRPKLHLIRCCAVLFANLSFFTGLAIMPLADAVAISFVAPIILTILSFLFFGERPGPWRWGAVVAGFLGVVIIMRPGSGSFQWAALLPFLGACGYAALHTLTRHAGISEKAVSMTFYPALAFIDLSASAGILTGDGRFVTGDNRALEFLLRAWVWPTANDWPLFLIAGVFGLFGGYLATIAYRRAEAGLVAPFEYIAMPMAVFWGVLVFGDWPDLQVWIGSVLIIGAGLVSLWRETRKQPTKHAQI